MTQKHVVAAVDEIKPGARKLARVSNRDIVVFNLNGEFVAISNRCPHRGASLCEGRLTGLVESSGPGAYSYSRQGEIIRCPWHGWEFDLRTGKSWCDPSKVRVGNYSVAVVAGAKLMEGPFVAETFTVSVENDYIVVEV
jgi:3-phenylpropionate/trans-cinnamate dioxygenase ferredoxin subunit